MSPSAPQGEKGRVIAMRSKPDGRRLIVSRLRCRPERRSARNALRRVGVLVAVVGVLVALVAISRGLAPPPNAPRPTAPWSDRCVGVADGDTISVMYHGVEVGIRLNAVDCPERRQAFGNVARRFTSDLVFGEVVTVRPRTPIATAEPWRTC